MGVAVVGGGESGVGVVVVVAVGGTGGAATVTVGGTPFWGTGSVSRSMGVGHGLSALRGPIGWTGCMLRMWRECRL